MDLLTHAGFENGPENVDSKGAMAKMMKRLPGGMPGGGGGMPF